MPHDRRKPAHRRPARWVVIGGASPNRSEGLLQNLLRNIPATAYSQRDGKKLRRGLRVQRGKSPLVSGSGAADQLLQWRPHAPIVRGRRRESQPRTGRGCDGSELAPVGARTGGDRADRAGLRRRSVRSRTLPAGAAERGYGAPKVGVRGAVFRDDGAILLVREVSDGRWALPGGWAEVNAAPAESVAREVREESGFAVVPRKLAAVFDRAGPPAPGGWPFHIYRLFFLCDIVGGAATPSDETSEVRFFGEHEIPDDLSANRSSHYHIARMFAHYRDPALPTEFD